MMKERDWRVCVWSDSGKSYAFQSGQRVDKLELENTRTHKTYEIWRYSPDATYPLQPLEEQISKYWMYMRSISPIKW